MPCSAYCYKGLISKKEGYDYFKFHKRIDFFISYDNEVLLGIISQYARPPLLLAPSKKDIPILFSLAKKKIYLDTHLKGELTDLF